MTEAVIIWTGFYMITASVMKELIEKKYEYKQQIYLIHIRI